MKIRTFILMALGLCHLQIAAQQTFKNEPLLLANTDKADIAFGQNWNNNVWRISPQIAHDTLQVKLYGKNERIAFRTDQDSISFDMKPGESKSFYVKMQNVEAAHTVIVTSAYQWDKVDYAKGKKRDDLKFFYENAKSAYSDSLRKTYPIEKLIHNEANDMQKVLSVLNWTRHQWQHDGTKTPKKNDAISILNEVKEGARFPCFAYAIVLRDQLTAYGFKARTLYLKTKDAETRKSSPGHVATEVYLNDQKKWIFIDPQFNVMPTLNGKPLNAVEFQQALSNHYDQVVLASRDIVDKRDYVDFVYDYLYYFDTALDNRDIATTDSIKLEGKKSLMLVPIGSPNLKRINFWNSEVNYCVYTNAMNDFYAHPK